MKRFWKKEMKLTAGKLLLLAVLFFLIAGVASGIFINFIFPYLATIPFFHGIAPRFPVLINKIEERRVVEGVNLQEVYGKARIVTVTLISQPAGLDFLTPSSKRLVGSGVLLTSDGLILTAKEFAESPQNQITAVLDNGEIANARVVASDPRSDLAILKIEKGNLTVVKFSPSENLNVGEKLVLVGPSFNKFKAPAIIVTLVKLPSVSSIIPEVIDADIHSEFIQIEPKSAIEFKGAALFNQDGKAVGLVTEGGVVPAEYLGIVIEKFLNSKALNWPSLGLHYQKITPALSKLLNLPKEEGILVVSSPGLPAVKWAGAAQQAGLREGDYIYKINGKEINNQVSFERLFLIYSPTEEIDLEFFRDGISKNIRLKLQALP